MSRAVDWELIIGFSDVGDIGDSDRNNFGCVLGAKVWLVVVQERITGEELEAAIAYDALKKFATMKRAVRTLEAGVQKSYFLFFIFKNKYIFYCSLYYI